MNIENIKELPSIVEAYKGGKIIQANYGNNQTMIDLPMLNMSDITNFIKGKCKLQVKQELEYVPFTFEDVNLFKDSWFIHKTDNTLYKIVGITEHRVYFSGNSCTYTQLFNNFTFLDGSPCGKLKQ